MRLDDALEQIDAIHEHMARAEVYRGFTAAGVAIAGTLGFVAAAALPWVVDADDPVTFVRYWLMVAAVCGLVAVTAALRTYWRREDEWSRRRTRRVFGQFVPCLAVGAIVTFLVPRFGESAYAALPGLWALCFGLGVFAMRPFLPRAIGWVGLFYLIAGAAILARGGSPLPWDVGGVFGLGHWATALVLYWNLERHEHGDSV